MKIFILILPVLMGIFMALKNYHHFLTEAWKGVIPDGSSPVKKFNKRTKIYQFLFMTTTFIFVFLMVQNFADHRLIIILLCSMLCYSTSLTLTRNKLDLKIGTFESPERLAIFLIEVLIIGVIVTAYILTLFQ